MYIIIMSLAVLKRKSQVLYNNLSVGTKTPGASLNSAHTGKMYYPHPVESTNSPPGGFSLNGTRRNVGYIGQSSLSRHYVRSLAKGNVLKGHGGCCGTYNVVNVGPSEFIGKLNDASVVKPTVHTHMFLRTKYYKDIYTPTVKPDSNQHATSGILTEFKGKNTAQCVDATNEPPSPSTCTFNLPTRIFKRRYFNPISSSVPRCNVSKKTFINSNKTIAVVSSSQHTASISSSCSIDKPPAKNCVSCPLPA